MVDERPIRCEVCGAPIEPGQRVLCNDGYDRIFGEFVLVERDDLHEDNWPQAHSACLGDQGYRRGAARLPEARVVNRRR
jgi:hypothetical protein